MAQCLRINFVLDDHKKNVAPEVKKSAHENNLEGIIQVDTNHILIIVCGAKDSVDQFVDDLHHKILKKSDKIVEIEPFIKDKDYRGVFRIIE